jgi:hypothetical protein
MKKVYRLKYVITAKIQGERKPRPINESVELPQEMTGLSATFLLEYARTMALSKKVFKEVYDVRYAEIQTGIEFEGTTFWSEEGQDVRE